MLRRCVFLTVFIAMLMALPALSQDEVLAEYYQGSYHFDYQQWPFGSYSGTFDATGEILDPDLGWAEGQTQSVGGRMEIMSDTLTVWGYGAKLNADTTVDVAAIFTRTAGTELLPGNYPVDTTNFLTIYGFFDNVAAFEIPGEGEDMAEWLANLVADHKFFSTSGSITFTEIDENGLAGTFTGSMADPGDFTIITVDNASFDMDGQAVTDAPELPAFASHGNFPNPFNPKTTLRFEMPHAGYIRARVFDVTGREVRVLAEDWFDAGAKELVWDGRDAKNHNLPGGVYLYKIETPGGVVSGKMVMIK
ncbi:T9SS type A sorting domain-containing protein [bacterium]|nr:T9SS type A sorting domain-containing protein [bacterium]